MSVRASTSASSGAARATCRAASRAARSSRRRLTSTSSTMPSLSAAFEMPKSSILSVGQPSRALREEEVRRLEVAVDDAARVRLGDALARLEDVARPPRRSGAARAWRATRSRSLPSRYSITMYGDRRRCFADVEHARDVLALQLRRGARLARSARRCRRCAQRLGAEELERDALVELEVRAPRRRRPCRPRRARARRGTCLRSSRRRGRCGSDDGACGYAGICGPVCGRHGRRVELRIRSAPERRLAQRCGLGVSVRERRPERARRREARRGSTASARTKTSSTASETSSPGARGVGRRVGVGRGDVELRRVVAVERRAPAVQLDEDERQREHVGPRPGRAALLLNCSGAP